MNTNGADRCHARDGYGQRCTIEGPHPEVTNSHGQRALAHETKTSLWSVPLSGLHVVGNDSSERELAVPDFDGLAQATQRTTAEWQEAWDKLVRKEAWPVLCQYALTSGGAENPVEVAHRINAMVAEYEGAQP